MNPIFVDLTQDTKEWKLWRAGGIGSSAAATIMYENPYQNRFQLFQKYMDLTAKPVEKRPVSVMANVSINFVMKATYSSQPLFVTVAK